MTVHRALAVIGIGALTAEVLRGATKDARSARRRRQHYAQLAAIREAAAALPAWNPSADGH